MTNLVLDLALLGFPTGDLRIDRALFAGPNPKLLEEILYFLLHLLNPVSAEEHFRECWPAINPQRSKHFRAQSLKLLEDLKRSGVIPRECVPRKSQLEEAVGERLQECLAKLAELMVVKVSEGLMEVDYPEISPSLYACEAFLSDSCFMEMTRLQTRLKAITHSTQTKPPRIQKRDFSIPCIPICSADFVNQISGARGQLDG